MKNWFYMGVVKETLILWLINLCNEFCKPRLVALSGTLGLSPVKVLSKKGGGLLTYYY